MPGKHRDPAYLKVHDGQAGVTVTFAYPDSLRTLVATGRQQAFQQARERWGDGWIGEPCVSSPWSIYKDLTGATALAHGQDHHASNRGTHRTRQRRRNREGK